jgi:PAS domain S-box-containing protein
VVKGREITLMKNDTPELKNAARLFAAISLCLLLIVAVTAYLYYVHEKGLITGERINECRAIVELRTEQICRWRTERMNDVLMLAGGISGVPDEHAAGESGRSPLLRPDIVHAIGVLQRQGPFSSVRLLDSSGTLLLASSGPAGSPDESDRRHIAGERNIHARFTMFHRTAMEAKSHLDLIVPQLSVEQGDTSILGYIVCRIDPALEFDPLVDSWPTNSRSSELLIVGREGDSVSFLRGARFADFDVRPLKVPLSRLDMPAVMAVKGAFGVVRGLDYRGHSVLAFVRDIPGTDWFIVGKVDDAEIEHPIQWRVGLAAAIAFLVLGVVLNGFAFAWTSGRKRLRGAMQAIDKRHRALNQHYAYLTKHANDNILLHDEEMRIVDANDQALAEYGYSREEMMELSVRELIAPGSLSELDNTLPRIRSVVGATEGYVYESLHRRKDHSTFPVQITSRLIEVEEQRFYQVVIRDITETRSLREQILRTDVQYRTLVDALPDGVAILDSEGRIKFVSSRMITMMGETTDATLVGRHMFHFIEESFQQTALEQLRLLTADHVNIFPMEYLIRRPNGTTFWAEVSSAYYAQAEIHLEGAIVIIRDITDRRRNEERLLELSRAVTQSPASIVITDKLGNIEYANPKFFELTGYTNDEVLGANPRVLKSGNQSTEFYKDLWDTITSGKEWRGEFQNRKKNGELYWESASISPIVDEKGVVTHYVAVKEDVSERKRFMETLRESEHLLQETQRIANLGSYVLDIPTGMWKSSDVLDRIFGIDASFDRSVEGWASLIHPEWRETMADYLRNEVIGRRSRFDREYMIVRRNDREERWVHGGGVLEFGPGGEPVKMIGTIMDVTDRKRAEAVLGESLERFELAHRATFDVIWDWDLVRNSVWRNENFRTLFGYDAADVEAGIESWTNRIHPDDHGRVWNGIQVALTAGEDRWTDHYRLRRKDGSIAEVDDRGFISRDAGGKATRIIGAFQDVTQRQRADERLRKSEEQFRLIAENITDLIAVLDLDGRRIYNSPSYRNLIGDPEMLRGSDSFIEIHPDDRERIKSIFQETVATGVGHRAEFRFLCADGTTRHIESQGSVIRDQSGNVNNVVVVSRDVTEQKMLELQFLRMQRLESLGTLAGGVAHDLNNVLAPIVLSIEVLRKSLSGEKELHTLNTLASSAQRGSEIVRQILAFARGMEGERALLQIRHLAHEVVAMIRETFPKSITIRERIPRDISPILGDSTQLNQLMMNLCVNARDAMPDGGVLTISAENKIIDAQYAGTHLEAEEGRYVMIAVEDSGTGMPPEVADRIFEPFFTTKDVGKGTGLGLSTVHTIVKSHKGFINVYSEVGKGTIFRVFFRAAAASGMNQPAVKPEELMRGRGECILVVDDEIAICRITEDTLEQFGYRVLIANDGAEALALYESRMSEIALVLTDMMMPVVDGPRMIRAMRAKNPEVKIIACSGFISDGVSTFLDGTESNAFITKPYAAEELLRTIRSVLDGPTGHA